MVFVDQVLKIDDPVGAFSVHGVNGIFGVICVGIFADGTYGDGWSGVPGTVKGLLYGDASLWRYATSRKGASWSLVPNGMGGAGKYGAAGVGNPWNQYAWSMAVYGDSLYLGTWDSRTVAEGSSRVADGKIGRAHV